MTAGPIQMYANGFLGICDGSIDFESGDVRALLLVHGHAVDLANDQFVSDVVADECADGDYSRIVIAGRTITLVGGKIRFDSGDADFGDSVTIAARYLVKYLHTGNDATSRLITNVDLRTENDGNLQSTNSDWDVAMNASGIYEVTLNV